MPVTPALWSTPHVGNLSTDGNQLHSEVVQLANGNLLVLYTTNNPSGVGSPAGTDVVGVIYSPLGFAISGEIRLNITWSNSDERQADVAALPDGGFVVVYEDFDGGDVTHIRLDEFDSTGAYVNSAATVAADNSFITLGRPTIAAASDTAVLIAFTQLDEQRPNAGQNSTAFTIYNPQTDSYTQIVQLDRSSGFPVPSASVLSNGNFVVGWSYGEDFLAVPVFNIITPTGSVVGNMGFATGTDTNGELDSDVAVAGLVGGGFVMAWTNRTIAETLDTDIQFQVFDNNGAPVSGVVTVNSMGINDVNNDPRVLGLADGSFVVAYDLAGNTGIAMQHYSASGIILGSRVVPVDATGVGTANDISLTLLADGRFALTNTITVAGDSEVYLFTFDTRDAPSGGRGIYAGTAGNDVISGRTDLYLLGGAGDDTLTQGAENQAIDGGTGNDLLIVNTLLDFNQWYGGEGNDTISFAASATTNLLVDLVNQSASRTSGSGSEILVGFENVIGTGLADVLNGDGLANAFYGEGGNDTLDGRGGNDSLFGGDGTDTLYGGDGEDILVGNSQIFVAQADNLFGNAGNDVIYGEAVDTIAGGVGFDSLIAINSFNFTLNMGATSIEYAVMDFGNDTIDASTLPRDASVFASGGNDTVTGSGFGDLLFGGSGNDTVSGGNGNDAIVGEAGVDILNGGDGDDRIYFDNQDTTVQGGTGYDAGYITPGTAGVVVNLATSSLEFIQDFAGGADTIQGAGMTQGFSAYAGGGGDVVQGSTFNDILWGEAGDDILTGSGGSDVLVGGSGADTLAGGIGNDALYGGAADGAQDRFRFTNTGAANSDAVYEFTLGTDKIDLSGIAGSAFGQVAIVTSGGSSTIYLAGQIVCIVLGVTGLTASDFLFAPAAPADPGDGVSPDEVTTLPAIPDDVAPAFWTPGHLGRWGAAHWSATPVEDWAIVF